MLNHLNMKSCELPPKGVHYLVDGTGRDSYIKKNNGGLLITPKISRSIIGFSNYVLLLYKFFARWSFKIIINISKKL